MKCSLLINVYLFFRCKITAVIQKDIFIFIPSELYIFVKSVYQLKLNLKMFKSDNVLSLLLSSTKTQEMRKRSCVRKKEKK